MPTQPLGDVSVEIDETLRHARDRVENQLAQYRRNAFIAVSATVLVTWLFVQPQGASPAPVIFFVCAAVYATVVRAYVRRRGSTLAIVYISLLCDVLVMVLPGALFRGIGPETDKFTLYLTAPG